MLTPTQIQSHVRAQVLRSRGRNMRFIPLVFLLPTILMLSLFQAGPALYTIYLSLNRLRRGQLEFVGFENYQRIFQLTSFSESIQNTLIYAAFYIIFTLLISLGLALLLNSGIKFTRFYLVLIFIPWVLSDVVTGTMWRWLFQPSYGVLQDWIYRWFPDMSPLYTTGSGAMGLVIAASVWQATAFVTLIILGALQTIPHEVKEAAAIDGANRWQRFFSITLPIISPTLIITLLLVSIRAINSVGLIYTTTAGGPGRSTQVLAVYLLNIARGQGDFGMGAAISVLMLLTNIALTLVYIFLLQRNLYQYAQTQRTRTAL